MHKPVPRGLEHGAGGAWQPVNEGTAQEGQDLGKTAALPPFPHTFHHSEQGAAVLHSDLQLAAAQLPQPSKPPWHPAPSARGLLPSRGRKGTALEPSTESTAHLDHCKGGMKLIPAPLVLPAICCGRSHPSPGVCHHTQHHGPVQSSSPGAARACEGSGRHAAFFERAGALSETSAFWLSSSTLLQWTWFPSGKINLQPPLLVSRLSNPGTGGNHQHRSQKTLVQVLPL